MGNAAEVSINRWGINLFWMQTWFVGNLFQLFFQKSLFMEHFIRTFLIFGMRQTYPFPNRDIWATPKRDSSSSQLCRKRYFRFMEVRDEITSKLQVYRFRNRVTKIYFSKIWFLKYQDWVVIATHFFKIRPQNASLSWRQLNLTLPAGGGTNETEFRKRNALSRRMHFECQWRLNRIRNEALSNYHF